MSYHTEDGSSMFRFMGTTVKSWTPAGPTSDLWQAWMNKIADVVWNKGTLTTERGAEGRECRDECKVGTVTGTVKMST